MENLQNYGLNNTNKETLKLHIVTADLFECWYDGLSSFHQKWLSANNFTAATGNAITLPDQSGNIEMAVGIVKKPHIWHGAKISETLPQAIWEMEIFKNGIDIPQLNELALGWGLSTYKFDKYRNKSAKPKNMLCPPEKNIKNSRLISLLIGTYVCRDLINTPPNQLTPEKLETQAKQIAKTYNAQVSVFSGDQLANEFPAIHVVGRASENKPRLIDMRWGQKGPKITLVGKGITFDTGGLDLKPSKAMEIMKKDMGGAATVLGLAASLMKYNSKIQLRVIIAAAENSVSERSMRPLDVIDTRAGIKVEVGNTDAEGRLVLADALSYAIEDKPVFLVDFATLTGAARRALGTELPALFANNQDTANAILKIGKHSADPLWQLPLFDDYDRHLDAGYSALSSTGLSSYGGAITAALFLRRFVGLKNNWAHIDLMAWNVASRPGRPKGGEAMGLRTLFDYINNLGSKA